MSRALTLTLLLTSGCIEDLGSRTVVDGPRVLAARTEVDGAAVGAASAVSGETVRVRFRIVDDDSEPATTFHLVACAETDPRGGTSECAAPPFAEARRLEPTADDPVLELEVPALTAVEPSGRVLVRGVFCIDGAPARATECRGENASSLRVRHTVDVVAPGVPRNHHPELDALELAGMPWPATAVPDLDAPCADGDLPAVRAADGAVVLSLQAAPGSFEALPGGGGTEEIQVSHQATGGELDRAFSFLLAPSDLAEVEWTPPEPSDLPEGGRIVRFWHVATDGRGGSDWIEAALCVLP